MAVTHLNVGCGDFPAPPPWTNLDTTSNGHVKPDIVGDLLDLPPDLVGLTAVYLGHVLEHLPAEAVTGALIRLRRRMTWGGRVAVVGPDVPTAQALHGRGLLDTATLDGARYGAGRWAQDVHLWECDGPKVVLMLEAAGWRHVHQIPIGSRDLDAWPVTSRAAWQCAVLAAAP